MATYTLNFSFPSSEELATLIAEGLYINIVRQLDDAPDLTLSWLATLPKAATSVSWTDDYYLYASEFPVDASEQILPGTVSQSPITLANAAGQGFSYSFMDAVWSDSTPVPTSTGSVKAINMDDRFSELTLGLAQAAIIDKVDVAASPISATSVPLNCTDEFMQSNTATVFLQKQPKNGVVLQPVPKDSYQAKFTDENNTLALTYSNGVWS